MEIENFDEIHAHLIKWYESHHRTLPWRAAPGVQPNAYHVLLSEVMLQQTTVATVIDYFNRFTNRWPTLDLLAQADQDELYHQWQGLGYYSRARNLHACVKELYHNHNTKIPSNPQDLIALPGIGPYTSASLAAIAYDYPIIPVDGNVTRVLARLLAMEIPLPDLKKEIFNLVRELKPTRSGDFAQSLMDLGATICKPKNPTCKICPISKSCKSFISNQQHIIPLSKKKPPKPTRYAYAFWHQDKNGLVCLNRRPAKGLLANMVGLPTSNWVNSTNGLPAIEPDWVKIQKQIKHTFTHFHLIVDTFIVKNLRTPEIFKVNPNNFHQYPISTLMAKIIQACLNKENT